MSDNKGRGNVVITGIGSGFGLALTKEFIARGYRVFGLLRQSSQLEHFTQSEQERIIPVIGDTRYDEIETIVKIALKDDPVSLLINNAGVGGRTMTLKEADANEIADLLNVHCIGALRMTRAVIQNLLMADAPAIVNVNSRLGSITAQFDGRFRHLETSYSYRIAKAAQNMLSACLSSEFGGRVQIYSITPGRLMTQISQVDADVRPEESAYRLVESWEKNTLPGEAGIHEIGKETIPW